MHRRRWTGQGLTASIAIASLGEAVVGIAGIVYPLSALAEAATTRVATPLFKLLYGLGYTLPLYAASNAVLAALGCMALLAALKGAQQGLPRRLAGAAALYLVYTASTLIAAGAIIGGLALLAALPPYYAALGTALEAARERPVEKASVKERLLAAKKRRDAVQAAALTSLIALTALAVGDYYYAGYQGTVLAALLEAPPHLLPGLFESWVPLEIAAMLVLAAALALYVMVGAAGRLGVLGGLAATVFLAGVTAASSHLAQRILTAGLQVLIPLRLLYFTGYTLLATGSTAAVIFILLGLALHIAFRHVGGEPPDTAPLEDGGEDESPLCVYC